MTVLSIPGMPHSGKIVVQTRCGNDIPNTQVHELTAYHLHTIHLLEKQYPQAEFKPKFIPIYNCHGMTFAARRTGIFEGLSVRQILREDKYAEIDRLETLPGDIIVYFDDRGDVEHSGFVLEKPKPPVYYPRIVSKWGHGPEATHFANHCPYSLGDVHYFRINE